MRVRIGSGTAPTTSIYSAAAAVGLIVVLSSSGHPHAAWVPLSLLLARVAISRVRF